jgi:hypothetical protein
MNNCMRFGIKFEKSNKAKLTKKFKIKKIAEHEASTWPPRLTCWRKKREFCLFTIIKNSTYHGLFEIS